MESVVLCKVPCVKYVRVIGLCLVVVSHSQGGVGSKGRLHPIFLYQGSGKW